MTDMEKIEAGIKRYRRMADGGFIAGYMRAGKVGCGEKAGQVVFSVCNLRTDKIRHFAGFDAAYRALNKIAGVYTESYEFN